MRRIEHRYPDKNKDKALNIDGSNYFYMIPKDGCHKFTSQFFSQPEDIISRSGRYFINDLGRVVNYKKGNQNMRNSSQITKGR